MLQSREHFVLPSNVTLLQTLSLLYLTVSSQYGNCLQELKLGSNEEETTKKLTMIIAYVRDGLIKIKRNFHVPHFSEVKEAKAVILYEDIRILEDEVKETLKGLSNESVEKRDPNWSSKILSKISKRNAAKLEKKDMQRKNEVERLRKERETIRLEQDEVSARKLKDKEIEIEERVRERLREEFAKERDKMLSDYLKLIATKQSVNAIASKSSKPREKRLDKTERTSYQQELQNGTKAPSSVNKAALIAWGVEKKTDGNQYSSKSRPNYVYDKPTIRRPEIKSPFRSPSKNLVEPVPETVQTSPRKLSCSPKKNSSKKIMPSNKSKLSSPTIPSSFDLRLKKVMENVEEVDQSACQQILNDILIRNEIINWEDISGLNNAKNSLKEAVVYPFLRPDLFIGLREPVTGILLFGPPGTGKTMIAKCIASESNSTFFSISASSVLSKFLGESEKLIRALFYLAHELAPSIIFIDEIDSLLTARSDNDNESSRRIKTEFLIRWSSLSSATDRYSNQTENRRVLVLAATNTPWDLDEAARRRFSKRIYIALPNNQTRLHHLKKLLAFQRNQLSESDYNTIVELTHGFSGSDLTTLAKDAAMQPIRDLGENLLNVNSKLVRPVTYNDFEIALTRIKKSVSFESLSRFEEWASTYGITDV